MRREKAKLGLALALEEDSDSGSLFRCSVVGIIYAIIHTLPEA